MNPPRPKNPRPAAKSRAARAHGFSKKPLREGPGFAGEWASPDFWLAALLILLCFAAFYPSLHNDFIWDDDANVVKNLNLRDGSGLLQLWTNPYANQQYYPLTHSSFWLQYQLFGLNPLAYHALNILLHSLSAVMLFSLLLHLRLPGAWLGAALFAIHPLQAESVAWITERKNVLAGVFLLATVHLLLWAAHRWGEKRSRVLYGLALGSFFLALCAKTAVATAPVAFLVLFWVIAPRLDRKHLFLVAPFVVLGIAAGIITALLELHHVGAIEQLEPRGWAERLLVAGRVPWFYLGRFFFPWTLQFIYPKWAVNPASLLQWLFPLATLAVLGSLWILQRRIGKGPLATAMIFGLLLAPASGIFDVYFFRYSFVQDHFQYFACMAIASFTGALCARWLPSKKSLAVVSLLLVLPLAGMTFQRTMLFKDSETLWKATLKKNPRAWIASVNLGLIRQEQGRVAEAKVLFEEALKYRPLCFEALVNLGRISALNGQLEEARKYFERSLEISPRYVPALINLGNINAIRGEAAKARTYFETALSIDSNNAEAHQNLGILLTQTGDPKSAIRHLEIACSLRSESVEARTALGEAWAMTGNWSQALSAFEAALRIRPDFPPAQKGRDQALGVLGQQRSAGN